MNLPLKALLRTNLSLKIVAVIIGAIFWFITSAHHTTTLTLKVPVCFYNQAEDKEAQAPEYLSVELTGKRADLNSLDLANLAVHIDLTDFCPGEYLIEPSSENLFLPRRVKLVNWKPLNSFMTVVEKENKSA